MPRLFVAVDLPPVWKTALAAASAGAGRYGGRPTAEANLHLTLYFLGDVAVDAIPDLTGDLEASLAGICAFSLPFLKLQAKADRMIWAAFDDTPAWKEVCAAVRGACAAYAEKDDGRMQTAHATLARFKNGGASRMAISDFSPPEASVAIASVDLMRSELSPKGPKYSIERRIPLSTPIPA